MPRPRHAPEGPDLEVDVGPFCVDGVYDLGMQIQNQQNHETIADCQMTMSSVPSNSSCDARLRITHLLPNGDLLVGIDPRGVRHAAGLVGDVGRLGDEQRARDARALRVVLDREIHEYLLLRCAEPCEGREDHSVAECDVSDLDGAKQCWNTTRGHVWP